MKLPFYGNAQIINFYSWNPHVAKLNSLKVSGDSLSPIGVQDVERR